MKKMAYFSGNETYLWTHYPSINGVLDNLSGTTDLNQAVSAGDYYEFKIVTPSFPDPNPATVRMSGYVTIRS